MANVFYSLNTIILILSLSIITPLRINFPFASSNFQISTFTQTKDFLYRPGLVWTSNLDSLISVYKKIDKENLVNRLESASFCLKGFLSILPPDICYNTHNSYEYRICPNINKTEYNYDTQTGNCTQSCISNYTRNGVECIENCPDGYDKKVGENICVALNDEENVYNLKSFNINSFHPECPNSYLTRAEIIDNKHRIFCDVQCPDAMEECLGILGCGKPDTCKLNNKSSSLNWSELTSFYENLIYLTSFGFNDTSFEILREKNSRMKSILKIVNFDILKQAFLHIKEYLESKDKSEITQSAKTNAKTFIRAIYGNDSKIEIGIDHGCSYLVSSWLDVMLKKSFLSEDDLEVIPTLEIIQRIKKEDSDDLEACKRVNSGLLVDDIEYELDSGACLDRLAEEFEETSIAALASYSVFLLNLDCQSKFTK